MGKKRNIGGIVPLTPTQKELKSWNILFTDYLFMEPQKDKTQEPGRLCHCTRCRKTYRVNEWSRVQTVDERNILCARHANMVRCVKCGTAVQARFAKVTRRPCKEYKYVAVIRANGRDEVLVDCYCLLKDYDRLERFTDLPLFSKCERFILRPGEATQYTLYGYYSRKNNDDDDPINWSVEGGGERVTDPFLSYKGCMSQRYEPYTLFGEYELMGTFLKYNALKEWIAGNAFPRAIQYLSWLCLYPSLEILVKAGYIPVVREIVQEKRKFYGKLDFDGRDPQSILKESRAACAALRSSKSDQVLMLKARKHHSKQDGWEIADIVRLKDSMTGYNHYLSEMLCFCNDKGTTPRELAKYLDRQHALRLRQYDEFMATSGCAARMGGVAPAIRDEWIYLRDFHNTYLNENGIAPRELYPKDVSAAHDGVQRQRDARIEREMRLSREAYEAGRAARMQSERESWEKRTKEKYDHAAAIDANVEKAQKMDKRLRWRIKHLSFADGSYMTVIPQRTRELVAEGEALHHCVGTYCERYAKSMTNIVFLRHKDHLEQPLLTVEVNNEGKVMQCYGFDDDRPYTKEKVWMDKERKKYLAVYDKEIRTFAEHYKEHLEQVFSKNNKTKTKGRTIA